MRKKVWTGLLALLLAFCLNGCVFESVSDLYALPEQAEDYYNLQQAINEVMTDGMVYAAPVSGENRQAVQLKDLDDDGNNEALVFVRSDREHPLRVYIFRRSGTLFSQIACLEGDGASFDTVQYVQLDGSGGPELIVGRQLSDEVLQTISVYSLRENSVDELLNTTYTEFSVLPMEDAASELAILRSQSHFRNGLVELYGWQKGKLTCKQRTQLPVSAENVRRVVFGKVTQTQDALFISSIQDESNLRIDVFAFLNGSLRNIGKVADDATGAVLLPQNTVDFQDIDLDGVIELPEILPMQTNAEAAVQNGCLINWYNVDLDGSVESKLLAYQNNLERWYVELSARMQPSLLIKEQKLENHVRRTMFYQRTGEEQLEVFSVYTCTGEDRQQLAQADGRFVIGSKQDAVFAASIGEAPLARELKQDSLAASFHLIPDSPD